MFKPFAICAALMFALAVPAAAGDAVTPVKDDVPQAVKDACKGDYERLCKMHDPDSDAARNCMAAAFRELSDPCVTAILDSPLADPDKAQEVAAHMQQEQDAASAADTPPVTPASTPKTKSGSSVKVAHAVHAERAPRVAARASASRHQARVARADRPERVTRSKAERHYAQSRSGKPRTVAGYINRGTSIANFYVSKYTRIAFAKAFH